MAGIYEMAKELGGALGRTEEYQALKRANEAAEEDRDLVSLRNRISELEAQLEAEVRAGKEPGDELRQEFSETAEKLQALPVFQRVVAAQANFEKVMYKVNETVAKGIEEGADSRIIIAS